MSSNENGQSEKPNLTSSPQFSTKKHKGKWSDEEKQYGNRLIRDFIALYF